MKKQFLLVALALTVASAGSVFAQETGYMPQETQKCNCPKCECPGCKCKTPRGERPKLYDKNGKELTNPPKPGEKVYDKNGKEITLMPPRHGHHHMKGPELNLTEKQKAEAAKIREASKEKIRPIMKEMHTIKDDIRKVYDDTKLTTEQKEQKVTELKQKLAEQRKKADTIRKSDMEKFEKLLTKEQKTILENFKKEHQPPKFNGNGKFNPPPQK